eukprot:7021683-Prymnesium_polylepis.1
MHTDLLCQCTPWLVARPPPRRKRSPGRSSATGSSIDGAARLRDDRRMPVSPPALSTSIIVSAKPPKRSGDSAEADVTPALPPGCTASTACGTARSKLA